MRTDVFGMAMRDYHFSGDKEGEIRTYSSLGEEDALPVAYLFREYGAMPELEKEALDLCRGRVLDIGCGAGSHSLHLKERDLDVTSLDISPGAVEVCRARGLTGVIATNFWEYEEKKFDSLLLLMNGIGIAGRVGRLPEFFQKARALLNPSGQILFDSSDIIYMFDKDEHGEYEFPSPETYYGEVEFEVAYKDMRSEPFPWLYIDSGVMEKVAADHGFAFELVRKGDHFDYLGKLSPLEY
ncbi:class I SAM-dependent methyltransferase [Muriicola sp.]|uniref:class I SAM-dependent methyltransferase n=1 Tax=Muriicola sp. TaxID=2020856 RepID=UPI003564EF0B